MSHERPPIRYAHTNLIARDWRRLAQFYVDVFGCVPVSSEREHHGEWFDALTALPGARLWGRHLRLPGYGENGPTLEIFQYERPAAEVRPELHRAGLAHLAFEVEDVATVRQRVIDHGGSDLGQLVTRDIPGAGRLTLIYMRDPEGNIIEVQHWHRGE